MDTRDAYRRAFTDWLACAVAGRDEPAARAAAATGHELTDRVIAVATAGHVLDFDDTYLPGLAHLSAPTAPVALVLGAALGAGIADVLQAYAAGFEAMGALTAASHPALYAGGWHPTAVCGTVGAAVTAAALLDLDDTAATRARNLAVLGAGGFRAAFGSDGKALQVGLAAAAGLQAARLAAGGADVPDRTRTGTWGFAEVFGGRWADPDPDAPAIRENWLKRYPCCLQTHGAIETAVAARHLGATDAGSATVTVHPISCDAAPLGADVTSGLAAKFSIPYCTALAIRRGHPVIDDFDRVDPATRALAARVEVRTDERLLESEARLEWREPDGRVWSTTTHAAVGSPDEPMDAAQLTAKLTALGAADLPALLTGDDTALDAVLARLEDGSRDKPA